MKAFFVALALASICLPVEAEEFLERYNVDITETTMSGLSSGAFMAHQLDLAQWDIVGGVALIAGGPYRCSKGRLTFAVDKCMQPNIDGGPDAQESLRMALEAERKGLIPPLSNLVDDKVYIFSGTLDSTVTPVASIALRNLYNRMGVKQIEYSGSVPAGHAMVTHDYGNDCASSKSPFIVDCDIDGAGDILAHLVGGLKPKSESLTGRIVEFGQAEFARIPEAISMAETGYVFVPQACAEGEPCRLHVSLHGCHQNVASIGMKYITDTGFLPWADSNNIVVLFPQTVARYDVALLNPNACWDWWGYSGDRNYATRYGHQIIAIRSMIDRIAQ